MRRESPTFISHIWHPIKLHPSIAFVCPTIISLDNHSIVPLQCTFHERNWPNLKKSNWNIPKIQTKNQNRKIKCPSALESTTAISLMWHNLKYSKYPINAPSRPILNRLKSKQVSHSTRIINQNHICEQKKNINKIKTLQNNKIFKCS